MHHLITMTVKNAKTPMLAAYQCCLCAILFTMVTIINYTDMPDSTLMSIVALAPFIGEANLHRAQTQA